MIVIKNTQRKFTIDKVRLETTAQNILNELGYSDFDLGIWLTTGATIRTYNKTYRDKDKPTDILSFPYHANLKPGERIKPKTEEDKNIGDIILAIDFIHNLIPLYETDSKKIRLSERLDTILVHGICHLLGYSHYDPENDEKMTALEKKIAKKLNIDFE